MTHDVRRQKRHSMASADVIQESLNAEQLQFAQAIGQALAAAWGRRQASLSHASTDARTSRPGGHHRRQEQSDRSSQGH